MKHLKKVIVSITAFTFLFISPFAEAKTRKSTIYLRPLSYHSYRQPFLIFSMNAQPLVYGESFSGYSSFDEPWESQGYYTEEGWYSSCSYCDLGYRSYDSYVPVWTRSDLSGEDLLVSGLLGFIGGVWSYTFGPSYWGVNRPVVYYQPTVHYSPYSYSYPRKYYFPDTYPRHYHPYSHPSWGNSSSFNSTTYNTYNTYNYYNSTPAPSVSPIIHPYKKPFPAPPPHSVDRSIPSPSVMNPVPGIQKKTNPFPVAHEPARNTMKPPFSRSSSPGFRPPSSNLSQEKLTGGAHSAPAIHSRSKPSRASGFSSPEGRAPRSTVMTPLEKTTPSVTPKPGERKFTPPQAPREKTASTPPPSSVSKKPAQFHPSGRVRGGIVR